MTRPDPYLTARAQWIPVLLVPLANGKTNKLPLHSQTLVPTDAHDPTAWTTYDQALALAQAAGPQVTVGFVITAADDTFCLDIDGALQADGSWSPLAQQLVAGMPGCFVEISQSGRGLHIWGRYPSPPPHRMKRVDLRIELYTELRFIAIGTPLAGAIAERCDALPSLIAQVFPPVAQADRGAIPSTGPRADWRGPTDDAELLRRAMQSRSAGAMFGTKASFADLWTANVDVLAKAYPPDNGSSEPYDRSSADAALASHLAFWTGCDAARIENLMRQSKLVRPKWDDRADYLVERTIMGACGAQAQVLQDKPPQAAPGVPATTAPGVPATAPAAPTPPGIPLPAQAVGGGTMQAVTGSTYLSPADQAQMFNGFVYVLELHRVLIGGGRLVSPEKFKSYYGGFTFIMDLRNEKTSRDAFEAFTQSQALRAPRVDGVCFRPDLPYGAVVNTEGRTRVNTFTNADVQRTPGDVTPFLRHLDLLLPVDNDKLVLLYYMAHCVQSMGRKFQWFPLLIGVEGNGKSFFSRCLARACGQRFTHWPDASKLGGQFNGWVFGKVFAAIEDLNIGDNLETWEKLKPLITGEEIEVEAKGVDQRTDEICVNFLANSNHKGAHKATKNDRRVAHLWCSQQEVEHLVRDGMDGDYMPNLYKWAKAGGYAAVAHYLATLEIPPEYGIDWVTGRAPRTSVTDKAIDAARGPAEQEILDAIERGEVGFRGDFISSKYLEEVLRRAGKDRALPINKRREVLRALGYDWHTTLTEGRVNNPVEPDGQKSKLFCKIGSPSWLLPSGAAVADAYTRANSTLLAAPAPR